MCLFHLFILAIQHTLLQHTALNFYSTELFTIYIAIATDPSRLSNECSQLLF